MIVEFVLFTGQTENSLDVLESSVSVMNEETESLFENCDREFLDNNKPGVCETTAVKSPKRTDKLTRDLKNYINSQEDSGTLSNHSRQTVDLNKNSKGSYNRNNVALQFRLNNSNDMKTTVRFSSNFLD